MQIGVSSRRKFLGMLSLLPFAATSIHPNRFAGDGNLPRIGYLGGAGVLHLEKAFVDELNKLGFYEDENIIIVKRLAHPNSTDAQEMAAALARMDLLLVVAASLPLALELRAINPSMPMVLVTCPGMVSNGFANTLQHPGGIYTGLDELPEGVTAKRLQLIAAAVPSARRIALLSATPGRGGHEIQLLEAQKEAVNLGLEVKPYRVKTLAELENALRLVVGEGMHAMLVFQGALTLSNRQMVVDFSTQHRLPVIYQQAIFAEIGGLMARAPDLKQQFTVAARYVNKILKGAKPGDLPVSYPEKYYLTLNTYAAEKMGIKFPIKLLQQADKIIDDKILPDKS